MNNQKARLHSPWRALLKSALERATKKELPFDLTKDWFDKRWTGRCELTDIDFDFTKRGPGPGMFSPSIDRITPIKGYTCDNCRIILFAVNALKREGTDEEMLRIARALIDFSVK